MIPPPLLPILPASNFRPAVPSFFSLFGRFFRHSPVPRWLVSIRPTMARGHLYPCLDCVCCSPVKKLWMGLRFISGCFILEFLRQFDWSPAYFFYPHRVYPFLIYFLVGPCFPPQGWTPRFSLSFLVPAPFLCTPTFLKFTETFCSFFSDTLVGQPPPFSPDYGSPLS